MTRKFNTIADAVPVFAVINPPFSMDEKTAEPMFTANETAQLMQLYAQASIDARYGSAINKKFGRLRCVEIEGKMAGWEKL